MNAPSAPSDASAAPPDEFTQIILYKPRLGPVCAPANIRGMRPALGIRPHPPYLGDMEIENISMDPNQPYILGQLDATIFPDRIPPAPPRPPELPAMSPPVPEPEDSARNLDVYA